MPPVVVTAAARIAPLSRAAWRTHLQSCTAAANAAVAAAPKANRSAAPEAWVRIPKAKEKQPFRYEDAVEEALCFGWIDGIIKTDEASGLVYQRFTPRRTKGSNWSEMNKQRVRMLDMQGLMTPAGWAAVPPAALEEIRSGALTQPPTLPPDFEKALVKADAVDLFRAHSAVYQRIRVAYLYDTPAAQIDPAVRKKRIDTLVKMTVNETVLGQQTRELLRKLEDLEASPTNGNNTNAAPASPKATSSTKAEKATRAPKAKTHGAGKKKPPTPKKAAAKTKK